MNYGYGGYGGYGGGDYGGGYGIGASGGSMYGGRVYSGGQFGGGRSLDFGGAGYSDPSFGGGYNSRFRGRNNFSGPPLGRRFLDSDSDFDYRPRHRFLHDPSLPRRRGNPYLHHYDPRNRRDRLYDAEDDYSTFGSARANRSDGSMSPDDFWDDDEYGGRRNPLTANNLSLVDDADFNLTTDRWGPRNHEHFVFTREMGPH